MSEPTDTTDGGTDDATDVPADTEDATGDTATDHTATDSADIGYAEALAELEDILEELEDDALDIDLLSDKVERAATLIAVCRSRISVAQDKVSAIVAELDDLAAPPS